MRSGWPGSPGSWLPRRHLNSYRCATRLSISGVIVDLEVVDDAVEITATVRTTDRTGVEMEALTAVSVAALAVVDMVKAVDKARRHRRHQGAPQVGWSQRRLDRDEVES